MIAVNTNMMPTAVRSALALVRRTAAAKLSSTALR